MRFTRHVAGACLVGAFAAFAGVAPASAAGTITLTGPTSVNGPVYATVTGTADPGDTVQLFEVAYVFYPDWRPADDWESDAGSGPVTAKIGADGKFSFRRYMDSGHYFQVRSTTTSAVSKDVPVKVVALADLDLKVNTNKSVTAVIKGEPKQPHLAAALQMKSGSSWTNVTKDGFLDESDTPAYTGQSGVLADGTYTFRASVGPDPSNGILVGYSAEKTVKIGTGVGTPTTPAPTKPTPKPTKPTPKPTPKPTTPPAPKAGSVQFTQVQYNSPGKDSGSNGSLNSEWVKLTNKTKSSINLRNWTVRDKAGHVFKFSSTWWLSPGKSLYIHTGKGKNVSGHTYWQRKGKGGYIWNNTGDTAYLRSYTGATIDTCKWGNGKGKTNC